MRAVVVLAFVLSGCATTIEDTRAMPLRTSYTVAKSVPALEHCIAGKLSWLAEPSVIDSETGKEISFQYRGITSLLVSLTPTTAGTTLVEARGRIGVRGRVRHDLEACL